MTTQTDNSTPIILDFENKLSDNLFNLIINILSDNKSEISNYILSYEEIYSNLLVENSNLNKKEKSKIKRYWGKYYFLTDIFTAIQGWDKKIYDFHSLSIEIPEYKMSNSSNIWVKILFFVLQCVYIEKVLPNDVPNKSISHILHTYRLYNNFKLKHSLDHNQSKIIKLLDYNIDFILLKLLLYAKEKIDDLNISDIMDRLKWTPYEDISKILLFYKKEEHCEIDDISELYVEYSNKLEKNGLDYYFLAKYYKDIEKNPDLLEELFNWYKNKYPLKTKNILFIWNHLLSLLVNKNKWEESDKIEKIYNDLKNRQNWNIKNYFTYLKYVEYKIKIFYWTLKNDKDLKDNKDINSKKKNLEELCKEIKKIKKDKIDSIYESWSYFEIDDSDNFLINTSSILQDKIDKLYSPNLIKIDEKYNKDTRVERLSSKIEFLESTIMQIENLWHQVSFYKKEIEDKFNDSRNWQIEILAIFSAIVLFVSWSIQLFTRLEDLQSAIIFTLFFAWSICILVSMVFRSLSWIKWVNLFIWLGLILLWLSFPKYSTFFGFENMKLNINSIEQKFNDLKSLSDYKDALEIENEVKTNKQVKNQE